MPLLDKYKKPKLFLSFRMDITKTKELEDRLLNELRKDYNLVLKTMHNYFFQELKDDYGEFYFQFGEGKLGHDLGLNTDNVLDRSLQEVFGEKTFKKLEENFSSHLKGRQSPLLSVFKTVIC